MQLPCHVNTISLKTLIAIGFYILSAISSSVVPEKGEEGVIDIDVSELSNSHSTKSLLCRTVSLFSSSLYQSLTMNISGRYWKGNEGITAKTIINKYYHSYFNMPNILHSAFSFFFFLWYRKLDSE